jgi:hypothetical protein
MHDALVSRDRLQPERQTEPASSSRVVNATVPSRGTPCSADPEEPRRQELARLLGR